MSENRQPPDAFIASRELVGIDSNGHQFPITLAIGLPYPIELGDWACRVKLEGLHTLKGRGVAGVDSLQALMAAQRLARQLLEGFFDKGGRLLDGSGGAPVSLQHLFQMNLEDIDITKKRFAVCIDEIKQNFVFGDLFAGCYTKTVTLSDGSVRTIELTPMIRDGRPVVEIKNTGHRSYMGLHGTKTRGKLMVQILDLDAAEAESRRRPPPASPVLPRDTSLIGIPDLVPPGFTQGLEILNDNATPMEFVVSILGAHVGLTREDATHAMLEIHTRGGALLPTLSLAESQRIAAHVMAEAAKYCHPLVCRPVSLAP